MRIDQIFPGLLRRLLARYDGSPFDLSTTILPVSIVDADIAIPAEVSTPTLGLPATAGDQVAPVAGTVLADTLDRDEGTWDITSQYATNDGGFLLYQRRDAANAVTIWEQRLRCDATAASACLPVAQRLVVGQGERLRIVVEANAAGGTTYKANLWATFVA